MAIECTQDLGKCSLLLRKQARWLHFTTFQMKIFPVEVLKFFNTLLTIIISVLFNAKTEKEDSFNLVQLSSRSSCYTATAYISEICTLITKTVTTNLTKT